MSGNAPRTLAARRAFCPTPPRPHTATESPGWTLASLVTVPQPVGTQQLMSAAWSSGMDLSTGISAPSGTTV